MSLPVRQRFARARCSFGPRRRATDIPITPSVRSWSESRYGHRGRGTGQFLPRRLLGCGPIGTFGSAGRNIFRDAGFRNWDFSSFKTWKVKERLTAQFRFEVFNVLNHLILRNPSPIGTNDPSAGSFGCGCESPDQAGTNPILGTGGARAIQLGLKLLF